MIPTGHPGAGGFPYLEPTCWRTPMTGGVFLAVDGAGVCAVLFVLGGFLLEFDGLLEVACEGEDAGFGGFGVAAVGIEFFGGCDEILRLL
jgi:hypothetical protein